MACDCDDLGGLVEDCSYLPPLRFYGDGTLFLGMELEIAIPKERQYECADLAVDTLGELGWLTSDESVTGFELTTHPMTYSFALWQFPWHLLPAIEARGGDDGAPNTGLHVHVSRAGFDGPAHVHRWMKLIHRNRAEVIALARRDNRHYAAFSDADRQAIVNYAKGASSGKFTAINTGPEDTFELRMFASSLQPEHVQAVLGFVDASVEYTRQLTVSDIYHRDGWSWAAFAAWTAEREQYAPLSAELQEVMPACV